MGKSVTVSDPPGADDDLINTANLLTVLVVVPADRKAEFEAFYDGQAKDESVVPRSAKSLEKLGQDKDKALLYRVVLFAPQGTDVKGQEAAKALAAEKFKKACRDAKFAVRDYPFTAQWHEEQNKARHSAMANFRLEHFKLLEKGHTIFSDLFQLWVHVKILRVGMDCALRYGFCVGDGPKTMGVVLVAPDPNKLVLFQADMQKLFTDPSESKAQGQLNKGPKKYRGGCSSLCFLAFSATVIKCIGSQVKQLVLISKFVAIDLYRCLKQ